MQKTQTLQQYTKHKFHHNAKDTTLITIHRAQILSQCKCGMRNNSIICIGIKIVFCIVIKFVLCVSNILKLDNAKQRLRSISQQCPVTYCQRT